MPRRNPDLTRDDVIAAITHAARDVVHAGGSDASVAVLDKALKAADAEGYGHAARAVAAAIVEELEGAPAAAPGKARDKRAALLAAAKAYADAEDNRLAVGKTEAGYGPAYDAAVAASDKAGKKAKAALVAFLAGAPDDHKLGGYLHTHKFAERLQEHDQILAVNRVKAKHAAEIASLQAAIAQIPTVIDPSGFAVGDAILPVGNWYPNDNKGKYVGIPPFGVVDKITHGGKRVTVIGLIADGTAGEPYTLRRGHEAGYMGSATGYKVLPESLASVYLHLSNLIEAAKKQATGG